MVTFDVKIQFGQIGIQQTPPKINMNIKAPEVDLQQSQPDLKLAVTFPQIVNIDQKACFREIGLESFLDAAREDAQKSQQHALDAITRIAQQGDEIAHIENKAITIGKVFGEVPDRETDINIDVAPKTRPKITFQEGTIRGQLVYGDVKPKLIPGNLGYSFQYGKIQVYLEKEPFIKIEPKGLIFDNKA